MYRLLVTLLTFVVTVPIAHAQIGQYRNEISIGFNAGYIMSNIGFTPKVNQILHGGMTGGISFKYVCEKYFNTICALQAEINYAQLGWKEEILDINNAPVINTKTGMAEEYSRTINYIQVPLFAHLGWGKEKKGLQFFFQAGPQFGLYLNESTKTNFSLADYNSTDRVNNTVAQDTMAVENKFDYGIAAGLGVEFSNPKVGHFQLEARYYYGLGNIYGDSKKDYFGKSNHNNIVIKLTYFFDILNAKNKV